MFYHLPWFSVTSSKSLALSAKAFSVSVSTVGNSLSRTKPFSTAYGECVSTWLHVQHYASMNHLQHVLLHNWRALWKNWISSTTMKLRKSLVKPVTWQNISSCSVLLPKIVMHDAFNVILWTSTNISMRRRAWRSREKEPNNSIYSAASLALWVIFVLCQHPQTYVGHDDLGWITK